MAGIRNIRVRHGSPRSRSRKRNCRDFQRVVLVVVRLSGSGAKCPVFERERIVGTTGSIGVNARVIHARHAMHTVYNYSLVLTHIRRAHAVHKSRFATCERAGYKCFESKQRPARSVVLGRDRYAGGRSILLLFLVLLVDRSSGPRVRGGRVCINFFYLSPAHTRRRSTSASAATCDAGRPEVETPAARFRPSSGCRSVRSDRVGSAREPAEEMPRTRRGYTLGSSSVDDVADFSAVFPLRNTDRRFANTRRSAVSPRISSLLWPVLQFPTDLIGLDDWFY